VTLTLKLHCGFLSYEESSKTRFSRFPGNPLFVFFAFEKAPESLETLGGLGEQIRSCFFLWNDVPKSLEQIGANRGQSSKDLETDPPGPPRTPQT